MSRSVGRFTKVRCAASGISADEFNDFFASVFTRASSEGPDQTLLDTLPSKPLTFTVTEVEESLAAIKRKSPGPDDI